MRVARPILLPVMVLLAGCAGPQPEDAPATASATPSDTAQATTAVALATTDTLHLLAAPETSLLPPNGTEVRQTPVTYRGGLEPGEGLTWRHTLTANATPASYDAHLWIRVTETLVAEPGDSCVWALNVTFAGAGATNAYAATCSGPNGPTVAPGDYELLFSSQGPAASAAPAGAGDTVEVTLRRSAFSPTPNDAVFALSGTEAFDSRVTLVGLAEPLAPP